MLPISDSKFQGTEIKYTQNKSKMQMLFNNKSQVSILSPLKDSANFQVKARRTKKKKNILFIFLELLPDITIHT